MAGPRAQPRRYVAVVGPGDAAEQSELVAHAEEVGQALAQRGAVVVCGGLGGVMAAVCRGAAAAGGTSVGLLPGVDRAAANPWVTFALPTGLGEARNVCVARSADAVVAIGGGYGTLSEIAFALRAGTPVVGLRTWALADAGIRPVDSPQDAAELAVTLAEAAGGGGAS
ncbi:MAG TPA: TIGR00725 family protein [Acidimicrobiales bacterium]|nr:TIGR00725 family protein [Acidimicrobiales bacterium]